MGEEEAVALRVQALDRVGNSSQSESVAAPGSARQLFLPAVSGGP